MTTCARMALHTPPREDLEREEWALALPARPATRGRYPQSTPQCDGKLVIALNNKHDMELNLEMKHSSGKACAVLRPFEERRNFSPRRICKQQRNAGLNARQVAPKILPSLPPFLLLVGHLLSCVEQVVKSLVVVLEHVMYAILPAKG